MCSCVPPSDFPSTLESQFSKGSSMCFELFSLMTLRFTNNMGIYIIIAAPIERTVTGKGVQISPRAHGRTRKMCVPEFFRRLNWWTGPLNLGLWTNRWNRNPKYNWRSKSFWWIRNDGGEGNDPRGSPQHGYTSRVDSPTSRKLTLPERESWVQSIR